MSVTLKNFVMGINQSVCLTLTHAMENFVSRVTPTVIKDGVDQLTDSVAEYLEQVMTTVFLVVSKF